MKDYAILTQHLLPKSVQLLYHVIQRYILLCSAIFMLWGIIDHSTTLEHVLVQSYTVLYLVMQCYNYFCLVILSCMECVLVQSYAAALYSYVLVTRNYKELLSAVLQHASILHSAIFLG